MFIKLRIDDNYMILKVYYIHKINAVNLTGISFQITKIISDAYKNFTQMKFNVLHYT